MVYNCDVASIAVSKFRRGCLKLLERLPPEGLTITKRGRPLATVTRIRRDLLDFIGCLPGLRRNPSDDLLSTGRQWDAESRHAHSPRRRRR